MKLTYKRNANAVMKRLQYLYEQGGEGRIFAVTEVPSPTLDAFRKEHNEEFCNYPDPRERIKFWDDFLKERRALEDDSIPSAYLSEFDQGLYGALVGGEPEFLFHPDNGWISSMVPPLIDKWEEFEELSNNFNFSPSNRWFRIYRNQLEIFTQNAKDKYGVSHFILIDGLNFMFELFGATRAYTELFDNPGKVKQVIDFALELNLKVQNMFFEFAPLPGGGTCSNMAEWVPGKVISESVDPFHMTSDDYFEKWGREAINKISGHFDGVLIHIHGNGRHLVESVSSLANLRAIYFLDDGDNPPAFNKLRELKKHAGRIPCIVEVDFEKFNQALTSHSLPDGTLYRIQNVPNVTTANRLMQKIRDYRI